MNINSQKEGFGKYTATWGENKKRNESNNNLKKIMVKNEIVVSKVGRFEEF